MLFSKRCFPIGGGDPLPNRPTAAPVGVAAVAVAEAEWPYGGVVVEHPRLQGVTSAFEGGTVR